jgi:hypothetical protein
MVEVGGLSSCVRWSTLIMRASESGNGGLGVRDIKSGVFYRPTLHSGLKQHPAHIKSPSFLWRKRTTTMLPPIDSSVLRSNPQFEQLYTHLTTSLLNSDGSTKVKPSQKSQDNALREVCPRNYLKAILTLLTMHMGRA